MVLVQTKLALVAEAANFLSSLVEQPEGFEKPSRPSRERCHRSV